MSYRRRRAERLLQLRAARVTMTLYLFILFSPSYGNNAEDEVILGPSVDTSIKWCGLSHLKRRTMQWGWRYLLYTIMILVFSYISYEFFQCQTGCAIVHTREVTAEDAFFTVRGTSEIPLS